MDCIGLVWVELDRTGFVAVRGRIAAAMRGLLSGGAGGLPWEPGGAGGMNRVHGCRAPERIGFAEQCADWAGLDDIGLQCVARVCVLGCSMCGWMDWVDWVRIWTARVRGWIYRDRHRHAESKPHIFSTDSSRVCRRSSTM